MSRSRPPFVFVANCARRAPLSSLRYLFQALRALSNERARPRSAQRASADDQL